MSNDFISCRSLLSAIHRYSRSARCNFMYSFHFFWKQVNFICAMVWWRKLFGCALALSSNHKPNWMEQHARAEHSIRSNEGIIFPAGIRNDIVAASSSRRAEIGKFLSTKYFHTLNGSKIASKLKSFRSVFCGHVAVSPNSQHEWKVDLGLVTTSCLWQFFARPLASHTTSQCQIWIRNNPAFIPGHRTARRTRSTLIYLSRNISFCPFCLRVRIGCRWTSGSKPMLSRSPTSKLMYLRRTT